MENIVTFLDEMIHSGQLRKSDTDGYECCRLDYHNGILLLRKGERGQRTIAAFFIPENIEVDKIHTIEVTDPMQRYLIEKMRDVKQVNCDVAKHFSTLCSIVGCTTNFVSSDSNLLFRKLFFWNHTMFWKQSWIYSSLKEAEERICNWIYGGY